MGDIRKQIIELIESYMDKTLSEGCYVTHNGKDCIYECDIPYGKIKSINNKSDWDYFNIDGDEICEETLTCCGKILGHYDITAVLKYMSDMIVEINIDKYFIVFYYSGYLGEIPNKPLHLYTEQEEKDLLDLLLKLK